jgi:hypothetical protein
MGGKLGMERGRVHCQCKQPPRVGAPLELGQLLDPATEPMRSLARSRGGTHAGVGEAHELLLLVLGWHQAQACSDSTCSACGEAEKASAEAKSFRAWRLLDQLRVIA